MTSNIDNLIFSSDGAILENDGFDIISIPITTNLIIPHNSSNTFITESKFIGNNNSFMTASLSHSLFDGDIYCEYLTLYNLQGTTTNTNLTVYIRLYKQSNKYTLKIKFTNSSASDLPATDKDFVISAKIHTYTLPF